MCKICAFSPKKPTKTQKFYISGRSRYSSDSINCPLLALPLNSGRPRSNSTAKRPPKPRAQMRLSRVSLRPCNLTRTAPLLSNKQRKTQQVWIFVDPLDADLSAIATKISVPVVKTWALDQKHDEHHCRMRPLIPKQTQKSVAYAIWHQRVLWVRATLIHAESSWRNWWLQGSVSLKTKPQPKAKGFREP